MEGKDVHTPPEGFPGRPVSERRRDSLPRRSRVSGWALAAVLAVIAIVLYAVRYALLPFVFAAAVAFVMDPVIRAVQQRLGSPRWVAGVLLYIAILASLGSLGYWIARTAGADLVYVIANAPEILRHFLTEMAGQQGITIFGHAYTPDQIVRYLRVAAHRLVNATTFAQIAGTAASALFGGFLLLVLMPYLMISGPRLAAGTIWLLPPERRHSVEVLLPKLVPALRRYLVGIFLVVVYTASIGWVGFGAIFHLPHAALLALAFGVLELVPVIGPLVSASVIGLVAVQQTSFWSAASLMVFAIALRLSIDNLAGPLLLGQAARIHPVVVIGSFVCGAMLFGIVGLLLAVPTAVIIKTALEHYYAEPIRGGRE